MAKRGMIKAVLDACVLYPAPVRDILLSFADEGLYQPRWTVQIQEEWIKNLLVNRPDLNHTQLKKLTKMMDTAFPDANVHEYKPWIEKIELPDTDDRHVVAAGIESGSDLILTFNLKDFPFNQLKGFGIAARHPDDFLVDLFDREGSKGYYAFEKQLKRLKNPSLDPAQLLHILRKAGLPRTATILENVR